MKLDRYVFNTEEGPQDKRWKVFFASPDEAQAHPLSILDFAPKP